jgi:hypothetical protein
MAISSGVIVKKNAAMKRQRIITSPRPRSLNDEWRTTLRHGRARPGHPRLAW